jgi:DNA-binding MarR family transcriptional regulator
MVSSDSDESGSPATSTRRAVLLDALFVAFRTGSAQSVMFSQAAADRMGMASSDIECFDLLALNGSMTAGRLAELTGLTTGAITGVIDRLERAGYARRERDPSDRRRVIVQPLLERAAEAAPVFGPLGTATQLLLERYSDDDLAVILDFFARANAMMHEQITRLRTERRAEAESNRQSGERPTREPWSGERTNDDSPP